MCLLYSLWPREPSGLVWVQEGAGPPPPSHFGLHGELNALFRWFTKSFNLSGPCGQMTSNALVIHLKLSRNSARVSSHFALYNAVGHSDDTWPVTCHESGVLLKFVIRLRE
jgi:hypothetical protein